MFRTSLWPALLAAALLSTGCPPPAPAPAPAPAPTPAPSATPATPVVFEGRELAVKCGCKIEAVKKCSEWVEVEDSRWVQMTGEHGLGSMPFCGKDGLRARVSGELTPQQTLHVTSITVLPARDAPRPPG